MNSKSGIWLGTLALAAVVATAGTASAKHIMGMFQDNNLSVPNGPSYTTCNGAPLWGSAYGYDSAGLLVCGVRPRSNGVWLTSSTCPTTAVKYQAAFRTSSSVFCSTAMTTWSGPIVACKTPPGMMAVKSGETSCLSREFSAFARGY